MYGLRAARLFDGTSGSPLKHPLVLIEDGRIVSVFANAAGLGDTPVIDLGDVTLLPGMIDSHQHLVLDATDDSVIHLASRSDEEVLARARLAARSALMAGITTVRDLGDRSFVLLALKEELAREPAAGPELLVAGPPITSPHGHCWFLGCEARGVEQMRAAVRLHAARGVDVIKVMVTGGSLTPGSVSHELQYGAAELRAVVEQAHGLGLTVTGHAKGVRGVAAAVRAGFDGIEHCLFLTPDGFPLGRAVVDAMAAAGTYVSVTAAFKRAPELDASNTRLAWLRDVDSLYRTMWQAGIRLVLSSDAGIGPAVPHDVLPYGAERLLRTGMTCADVLRSLTSLAALACGVADRKGRIASGYDADLTAVSGDPLVDVNDLLRVAAVFRRGVRVR